MTAAGPVCSPASSQSSQSSLVCLPACHLKKGRAFQTTLPLRSAPGVWLLLGTMVILVGMAVAVAGYVSATPKFNVKDAKDFKDRANTHVKRMKLVGPVVMGVGLFIFICAATLLYENRDQDLKHLKGGSGCEDSQERPIFSCQECKDEEQGLLATPTHALPLSNQNCGAPLPPSHRNTHNISSRSSQSPPSDAGGRDREEEDEEEEEEEEEGRATLLAQVLHHQEPTPPPPSPCPSVSHSSSTQTLATPVK